MLAERTMKVVAAVLLMMLVATACGNDEPAEALYGSWATDLAPLGHDGFSHLTINSDGSFESDLEFVVAGSDCLLDRTTTGSFEADGDTATLTHDSGTQAVRQCTGDNAVANHDERAMTDDEVDESNAVEELTWSIEGDVLTMSDGADITRTYTARE